MHDVENIDKKKDKENKMDKENKILIVFDDMIADTINIKKIKYNSDSTVY